MNYEHTKHGWVLPLVLPVPFAIGLLPLVFFIHNLNIVQLTIAGEQ